MLRPTLCTRLARTVDAEALADIRTLSWEFAYRGVIPEENLKKLREDRPAPWFVRAIEKRNRIRVVTFGGNVIGYSYYGRNRAKHIDRDGEIFEIYVHPDYLGIGAGKLLLQDTIADLKEFKLNRVMLWIIDEAAIGNPLLSYCSEPFAVSCEEFGTKVVTKRGYDVFDTRQNSFEMSYNFNRPISLDASAQAKKWLEDLVRRGASKST